MEQFDYVVLNDFIGQNWAQFLVFAEGHGLDEAACEDLANRVETAAGMNT